MIGIFWQIALNAKKERDKNKRYSLTVQLLKDAPQFHCRHADFGVHFGKESTERSILTGCKLTRNFCSQCNLQSPVAVDVIGATLLAPITAVFFPEVIDGLVGAYLANTCSRALSTASGTVNL